MNERIKHNLADIRQLPKQDKKLECEVIKELIPDESYLMPSSMRDQLLLGTELVKGKVVDKCMSTNVIDNIETVVAACDRLTINAGCSKPLIIENGSVSCGDGKGVLRISSANISELNHSTIIPLANL